MSETRKKMYLSVADRVHRLARVGAATLGTSMSEFVSCLILEDATRRGIDEFVRKAGAEQEEQEGETK